MSGGGWASCALALAALLLALPLGYLGLLTLMSRVRRAPAAVAPCRFAVVVPAHNEAGQIAETIASLVGQAYPEGHREVWVVADNCTDQTAAVAAAAGAQVLVRTDAERRGKGYALEFAFAKLLGEGDCEAVVVVDADTIADANLLSAFAARLAGGAWAVQADYGVRNPDASWRTRLMAVALGMFHRLRSLGRSNLGLSVGLRGNGMCFSRRLLAAHPHRAHGLVEDVEYGIEIGRGGHSVAYVDEARVRGEMVSGGDASRSQRQRWEGGRRQLLAQALGPLLREAWDKKSGMLLDLAVDLMVPPLSTLGLALAGGLLALGGALAAALLWQLPLPHLEVVTALWALDAALLAAYVARGAALSGLGLKAASALAYAPFYVLWKVALKFVPQPKSNEWVRTSREGGDAPSVEE